MDETTQRIKMIMEYYSMNTLEFSEKIRIREARLEQILKGRQVVSLNIIQLIIHANREINADWLILGVGEMLRN